MLIRLYSCDVKEDGTVTVMCVSLYKRNREKNAKKREGRLTDLAVGGGCVASGFVFFPSSLKMLPVAVVY